MEIKSLSAKFQEPFEPNDIKWRVRQSGLKNGKPWMIVLPYITGRAIQNRLDDVMGVGGWQVEQEETKCGRGFLCTLSLLIDGHWVKKQDVAPRTDIEELKGGASGALKRAGALCGIGRYLYQLKEGFAYCVPCEYRSQAVNNFDTVYEDKKKKKAGNWMCVDWQPPKLPDWALPNLDYSVFSKAILDAMTVQEIEQGYDNAYRWASSFGRLDLLEQFKKDKETVIKNLDSKAMEEVAERLHAVTNWLDDQIKNINLIPDAGAVHKVSANIRDELVNKCAGQYFDESLLYSKFKKAIQIRINIIEGGQNGK